MNKAKMVKYSKRNRRRRNYPDQEAFMQMKEAVASMGARIDSITRDIAEAAREGMKPNPRFMETGPRRNRP